MLRLNLPFNSLDNFKPSYKMLMAQQVCINRNEFEVHSDPWREGENKTFVTSLCTVQKFCYVSKKCRFQFVK